MMPLCAFADEIEVNGQFVVAPVSSDKCEASSSSTPTYGVAADSKLMSLLTPFFITGDDPTSVHEISIQGKSQDEASTIYDINGQKHPSLQHGINIVIDKEGNRRKIIVK